MQSVIASRPAGGSCEMDHSGRPCTVVCTYCCITVRRKNDCGGINTRGTQFRGNRTNRKVGVTQNEKSKKLIKRSSKPNSSTITLLSFFVKGSRVPMSYTAVPSPHVVAAVRLDEQNRGYREGLVPNGSNHDEEEELSMNKHTPQLKQRSSAAPLYNRILL